MVEGNIRAILSEYVRVGKESLEGQQSMLEQMKSIRKQLADSGYAPLTIFDVGIENLQGNIDATAKNIWEVEQELKNYE